MRAWIVLAVLLCAGVPSGAGEKKQEPKITVQWESGQEVTIDGVKEKSKSKLDDDDWVWVAYQDFKPLMQPRSDSDKPSGADPLPFLKRVNLLYTGDYYSLIALGKVGSTKLKFIGWVPTVYLVKSNQARRDGKSTLYQRAMIVNTASSLKTEEIGPPAMLLAPDPEKGKAKGKANTTFRLFNIYFVYGDTNPGEDDNGYILLGSRTEFPLTAAIENEDVPGKAIHGWVKKNRICRWTTREAVKWDPDEKRTDPVLTYKNKVEAEKAYDGKPAKVATSEEFISGKPREWSHGRMRYPIVALDREKNEKSGLEVFSVSYPGNTLRKVGVVGALLNEAGNVDVDIDLIEQYQARLGAIEKEVGNVEILFVVDETRSMSQWFRETARTIEDIVSVVKNDRSGLEKKDSRRLKFAVTFFSDIEDDGGRNDPSKLEKAVDTTYGQLAEVDSPKAKAILEELRARKGEKDGFDPREQVYFGLQRGIETARFSPIARKLVILITDNADHDGNKDGMFSAEKRIVNLLTPKNKTPIEFYALQVVEPKTRDEKAYKTQADKIIELLQEATLKTHNKRWPARYFQTTPEEKEELRKFILHQFTELRKESEKTKEMLRLARLGQFELIDKLAPEFISRLGLTDEQLNKLKKHKGAQVFDYAYVWEMNPKGVNQIRKQLLVSRGDLLVVKDLMDRYFHGNKDAQRVPDEAELTKILVDLQAGMQPVDPAKGEKPREDFETVMKIKHGFEFKSPLLKKTVSNLKQYSKTQMAYQMLALKKRALLVEDILAGKKFQYSARNDDDTFLLVRGEEILPPTNQPQKYSRGFLLHESDGSAFWYWLDYDEEWP